MRTVVLIVGVGGLLIVVGAFVAGGIEWLLTRRRERRAEMAEWEPLLPIEGSETWRQHSYGPLHQDGVPPMVLEAVRKVTLLPNVRIGRELQLLGRGLEQELPSPAARRRARRVVELGVELAGSEWKPQVGDLIELD